MEWTREQEKAIYTKKCNLLVAAGAGSGKTAVLVERIINKIVNEEIDIDKLLVVTFTKAAASEMRERIADSLYKLLEENPKLQKQILLLNKANITTLHSFCLKVIKDNFFKIDLDPNFRIADDTECELLKLDAIEEVLENIYDDDTNEFDDILNIYTDSKGDTLLKETLIKVYDFIQSSPFPYEWLEEKCELYNVKDEVDFSNTIWGKYLLKYAKDEIIGAIEELEEVVQEIYTCEEAKNYLITLQEDIFNLKALEKIDKWDDMYGQISLLNFSTLKQSRKAPDEIKKIVKEVRDKVKENIRDYLKENIFVSKSDEVIDDLKLTYKNLKTISNLVKKFDEIFTSKKRDKNILDFGDIEHICLKLLTENEDIRNMYKEKFDEILIDEYQDSNLIQEYIINTISNQKTFMVGDVKQSIYRFRQARPELFLDKYHSYSDDDSTSPNQKILLFKNFRSNKNVIDATNYIFSNIMSKELGEIDYTEKEYLQFGADYYPNIGDNIEVHLIENKMQNNEIDDDITEKPQFEGKVIASKISDIVGKLDVYDKHTKSTRKAEYRDIVILLRATTRYSDCFVQELSKKGIPVFCDSSLGYFNTNELQTIVSLLKIIDNPIQDIPLITVLRSPIGNFTSDELVDIRVCDRNIPFYNAMQKSISSVENNLGCKISKFLNTLDRWREESKYLPLNEFIWKLYVETGYYNFISLLPDGMKKQANLKLLIQRAESYERTSYKGLFNFINYIENIKNSNNDLENSRIIGESENVVRIMSIHKSKGLEFPVVFLSGTSRPFNKRDFQDKIVLHQEFGFGTDIIKYDKRIQYPSIPKLALIQKSKVEALSEEMRILYVAMTRAREKLIITTMTPNIEKLYEKLSKPISKYRIGKASSIFDWIGLSILDKNINWKINEWRYDDIISAENSVNEKYDKLIENIEKNFVKDESYEKINNILSWKYPYAETVNLPTKISISEIKSRTTSDEEQYKMTELIEKPEFMEENITSGGASYGTIVHAILQAIDFKNPDIDYACKNINADEKIINIAKKQIADFQNSSLFRRIQMSDIIKKETSFNLNIPVNSVYDLEKELDEKIMIQGIIDLYFIENGEIVLVDYKTDNIESSEELVKRYKLQLEYYKMALEKITGLKVKESIIYSLKLKEEIRL